MVLQKQLEEQLQQFDFDSLVRKQADARCRVRLLALAHLKDGKNYSEVARSLRVTRHAVRRWARWFVAGGIDRLAGVPHTWSPQRLPKEQEEPLRLAIERAQAERGGGRIRGEDIRQLLHDQFHLDYSLNGVYHMMKRMRMCWISARAISPQADLHAQAEFKKNVRPARAVGGAAARPL
ncbi:MAG TPA: winged helix-turn-helix domain-containing protein [Anaerolineae bacterium]